MDLSQIEGLYYSGKDLSDVELMYFYQNSEWGWNAFAKDILRCKLDPDQDTILHAIRWNPRVSVCSGTARGKDFLGSVASLCFLYLTPRVIDGVLHTSIVINTAPTQRQVEQIMMGELKSRVQACKMELGGKVLSLGIHHEVPKDKGSDPYYINYPKWYLKGFKSSDNNMEAWSGIHNRHIMIVVTEATGLKDVTYQSIYRCLQGEVSRFVMFWNANCSSGEAYDSISNPTYKYFNLNCLNAPNVINEAKHRRGEIDQETLKQKYIPGQVDLKWVEEMILKPGWTLKIGREDVDESKHDFAWDFDDGKGVQYFRPQDAFRSAVMGLTPEEGDDVLIPHGWVRQAMMRWEKKANFKPKTIGLDVAGMGVDSTVACARNGNYVDHFKTIVTKNPLTVHVDVSERVLFDYKSTNAYIMVDAIGEGAGVASIMQSKGYTKTIAFKSSRTGKGLTDFTEFRKFRKLRDYVFWQIRDWLNPANGNDAMLPNDPELLQELSSITYEIKNGEIVVEEKPEIKAKINRSPDKADALAMSFCPIERYATDLDDGVEVNNDDFAL